MDFSLSYPSFGSVPSSGLWSLYFLWVYTLQCLNRILKRDTKQIECHLMHLMNIDSARGGIFNHIYSVMYTHMLESGISYSLIYEPLIKGNMSSFII